MSKIHKEVMCRFIDEVVNNRNFSVLNELIHPNYVYRSPDQELHGPEGIQDLFTAYHVAFPDLHIEIDDLIATDEKVVISFTLTGTHKKDMMGIAATDKQVKVHGVVMSRFEEGKIVEEWEILDQLTMFQQLGIVSLPA